MSVSPLLQALDHQLLQVHASCLCHASARPDNPKQRHRTWQTTAKPSNGHHAHQNRPVQLMQDVGLQGWPVDTSAVQLQRPTQKSPALLFTPQTSLTPQYLFTGNHCSSTSNKMTTQYIFLPNPWMTGPLDQRPLDLYSFMLLMLLK